MSIAMLSHPQATDTFRHDALFYAGEADFLKGTTQFIRGALGADEPILVVLNAAKIDWLRSTLGRDADAVEFADMAQVGANPARIIPAWRDFVTKHVAGGRRLRGIGEPIWAERSPAELIESQRHEALLNVAFDGNPAWWLLCPYDTEALDRAVLDEAQRSHPFVWEGDAQWDSTTYVGVTAAAAPLQASLPEPSGQPAELVFDANSLASLRRIASREAARAGLRSARVADFVLAVNEVASNSLRFGDGQGRVRVWHDSDGVVAEIRDGGRLTHPLADRERPGPNIDDSRGLWLVNQLCDLVQIRSSSPGTVARLHMRRG